MGPEVDAFESEIARFSGRTHAVALSSGTAALHLGLLALHVKAGDEVVVPTLTFGASAFAVTYTGASPVFLDVEEGSWNLDPDLLGDFLAERAESNSLPAAVLTVDVFGRTCDYDRIIPICEEYGVPALADSAEALGAAHGSSPAGSFAAAAAASGSLKHDSRLDGSRALQARSYWAVEHYFCSTLLKVALDDGRLHGVVSFPGSLGGP